MGRFILIVLILLVPSQALAAGCVGYSSERTFVVEERLVFVLSAILSEETTEKLLEIHHGVIKEYGAKNITLERNEKGKWVLKIKSKTDATICCVPVHIDVAIALERRHAELVVDTVGRVGRVQKSTMTFNVKKLKRTKTQVTMKFDVVIWRRFPNTFRRMASRIAYDRLNQLLYQSEQIIRKAIPETKKEIIEKAYDITEEYLDLLLDNL